MLSTPHPNPNPLSDHPSPLPFVPFVPVDNFTSAIILYTHTMFTYMVVCDYLKSRNPPRPMRERASLSLRLAYFAEYDYLKLYPCSCK